MRSTIQLVDVLKAWAFRATNTNNRTSHASLLLSPLKQQSRVRSRTATPGFAQSCISVELRFLSSSAASAANRRLSLPPVAAHYAFINSPRRRSRSVGVRRHNRVGGASRPPSSHTTGRAVPHPAVHVEN